MLIVYNLIRFFLYFVIMILSLFNRKLLGFFKTRLFQKISSEKFLGKNEKSILIHLSSVGEFNLSCELIEKILSRNEKVIISVMTDTGFLAINKKYSDNKNVKILYFPLDDFFVLKKIYKRYKIKKTIIIETEIWVNLYYLAAKFGDLFVVNGRLTDKKMKSYKKVRWFISSSLNKAKKILVQSEKDAKRYENLKIKSEKIKVFKNLKYSIKYDIISEERKNKYFKEILDKNKKIIVCGSTRENEERIWMEVLKKINIRNEYQLVLVPRHLERIKKVEDEILKLFPQKNYSLLSDFENWKNLKKTEIVVVNKMGVLTDFYQMADFVFVGGTLVNVGGHSILEPLYYGRKPIIGKYYQNIEQIVNDAKKFNFVEIAESEDEIINYLKSGEKINTKEFFEKNNEIDKIVKEIF